MARVSATSESSLSAGRPLPSGTVTFAFTDIEGSTQRWDRDPAAMQAAVRRHDEIMRAAIVEHCGHVFKTIGDAFCAAFGRAEDAVAALLAAQRALAAEDFSAVGGIRVRAAIHTGTADERDDDYFGLAVNRVARLLAVGHGGQVLISGVTADLVRGELPPQVSLGDLGEHRLRDLTRPERVYQLLAPDLTTNFPPLRSIDARPNNLPRMLTSFVGRESEIAEITALFHAHQLVTLVGSGGVGKTRTALQVAAKMLEDSSDGVWFVELAPLTRGEYVPTTVAQALGLTLPPEGDLLESLVRALKDKPMLLLFDNCEHLVEATARVVSALLRGCPKVRILASSRQGLGVAGEQTYRLPSLGVPNEDETARLTSSDALQSEAVALFVERARAVDRSFTLTDQNAPVVADICRRLDGIALAIELAAARVRILSPRQLRDRLDERFRVLTGGSRDALPRQQTLRALIDWSHDLLDERERTLFRRLGIFVNGFTLEGAAAVGGGADLDELDAFEGLASLVDKSLVLAEPDGDSLRYRLLESTRVHALEKLDAAGERAAIASRHLRYLRNYFTKVAERRERSGRLTETEQAVQTELEDVRSALDVALAQSDATEGGEILASIGRSWRAVGLEAEGAARCERYLEALPRDNTKLLALLSCALSYLVSNCGRTVRAVEVAIVAVTFARQSGDPATLAEALTQCASRAVVAGRHDEAEAALAEAEGIPETLTSPGVTLVLLETRALLSLERGDFETAARALEHLRKQQRALGNAGNEFITTLNLAELEHERGQTPRAIAILQETIERARSAASKKFLTALLLNLAGYLAAVEDVPGAVAAAREAIGINAAREPDHIYVAIGLEHLALVYALRGDFARAAALEGYADAAFTRNGFERELTEATTHGRLTTLLGEGLEADELARLTAEGAALLPETAIALALDEP
jgi:predicted ATPase/class 3 adenylate cyclase